VIADKDGAGQKGGAGIIPAKDCLRSRKLYFTAERGIKLSGLRNAKARNLTRENHQNLGEKKKGLLGRHCI